MAESEHSVLSALSPNTSERTVSCYIKDEVIFEMHFSEFDEEKLTAFQHLNNLRMNWRPYRLIADVTNP